MVYFSREPYSKTYRDRNGHTMAESNTRQVKNKAVAQLQISAEQILLEAFERKEEPLKVPLQKFTDLEEVCSQIRLILFSTEKC